MFRAKRARTDQRLSSAAGPVVERLEDRRLMSAAGTLDPTFGVGGKVITDFSSTSNDQGKQVVVGPDGKIIVVGNTGLQTSPTRLNFALARYNPDGSLDTSFGTGGKVVTDFSANNDLGLSVVIQSDGKVVAGGVSGVSTTVFALARYNTDGSLDTTFGANEDGKVLSTLAAGTTASLGIQQSGRIVLGGTSNGNFSVSGYTTDGFLDTTFGVGATGTRTTDFGSSDILNSIAIAPDGKIVAAGSSGPNAFASSLAFARYTVNGAPDNTFNTNGRLLTNFGSVAGSAQGVVIQPDGKIVAAGTAFSATFTDDFAVIRLNPNGSLDTSFDGDGKVITDFGTNFDDGWALTLQGDGKIVVAGTTSGGFGLVRYNTDGSVDSGFGTGGKVTTPFTGSGAAFSIARQPDGKVVVAGQVGSNPNLNFGLARYNTIATANSAPVASGLNVNVNEDTTASAALSATDADNDNLSFRIELSPAHGTLQLNANGSFSYTPSANFNGSDSFNFTAFDGQATSNVARVNITINPVNDAPTTHDASFSVNEDGSLSGTLQASDIDSAVLTFVLDAAAAHGTVSLSSGGSFSYLPAANFNGSDTFRFHVSDGALSSGTATVNISVNPVNDAPTTHDASFSVDEDGSVTGTLQASDVDSSVLTFVLDAAAAHGTISLSSSGSFTYIPEANFNGSDTFTFHVNDGSLSSGTATATITVNPVNDPPTTHGASFSVDEDTSVAGTLEASDIDSAVLTFVLDTATAHGTIHLSSNGSFRYIPEANFNGSDTFVFHVSDGALSSGTATATITVNPVNDAPTANSVDVDTAEDSAVAGQVSGDDIDGDALTFQLLQGPEHGTVQFHADGTYSYTPAANYNGTDSFTFSVSDGSLSDVGNVNLNIRPINDSPVANNASASVNEDGAVNILLSGQDIETASSKLTFTITSLPAHGALTYQGAAVHAGDSFVGSPAQVRYEVGAGCDDVSGDSFTFTVTDTGDGDSAALTSAAANVAISIHRFAPASASLGGDGVLRIAGTSGDDSITVNQQGGNLQVLLNGQSIGGSILANGVSEIRIWGRAGNDTINVSSLTIDAFIHGGAGDDVITGGAGNDLLLGGGGNDQLTGASGNDFLIGGDGSDRLVGSAGHDVLVAGDIDCQFTAAQLRAIATAWAADKTVSEDDSSMADDSVTDDNYDVLTGASGADWFIINAGDKITDLAKTLSRDGDAITYVN